MTYLTIQYHLRFAKSVAWMSQPEILFRSVLGMHLKILCCVLRDQESCAICPLNQTCVYAWFFETHISKDTDSIEGRDRAPHPFIMEYEKIDDFSGVLMVRFLGRARNFIPYISISLERAGQKGVGKERISYIISAICSSGRPYEHDMLQLDSLSSVWHPSENCGENIYRYVDRIQFVTPCRIKKQGQLLSEILLEDLLVAIVRRMSVLESLFGESLSISYPDTMPLSLTVEQKWKNINYYSVRQQEHLKMGGVLGEIHMLESIPESIWNLLVAGQLFHIGKNVSFGLGRIALF